MTDIDQIHAKHIYDHSWILYHSAIIRESSMFQL